MIRLAAILILAALSFGGGAQAQTPWSYLTIISLTVGDTVAIGWQIAYEDAASCESAKSSALIRTIPLDSPSTPQVVVSATTKALASCSENSGFPQTVSVFEIPVITP